MICKLVSAAGSLRLPIKRRPRLCGESGPNVHARLPGIVSSFPSLSKRDLPPPMVQLAMLVNPSILAMLLVERMVLWPAPVLGTSRYVNLPSDLIWTSSVGPSGLRLFC